MALTARDREKLATCDARLGNLFEYIEKRYSLVILEGHRGEQAQNAAFNSGKSKLKWPNGKHNELPSLAVDAAPLPLNWNDRESFSHFAGYVQGCADCLGFQIRWGGDWDQDRSLRNNSFDDLVHFELVLPTPLPGMVIV